MIQFIIGFLYISSIILFVLLFQALFDKGNKPGEVDGGKK
jgi:hypothetical protein